MFSKKMTRRRFLAKAAAAAAGLTLVGLGAQCGATPAPTPTPEVVEKEVTKLVEVPAKAEKITLRVMTLGGVRGEKAYEFGERFMKQYPHITVKNEDVVWAEFRKKTEMNFATGNLWDLCYGHASYLWVGAVKGWYIPLDDLLATGDLVPDYDDMFPVAVENLKWEGKTYCVMDRVLSGPEMVVCWNRHLFKEAGVPEPDREKMDLYDLQEMALKLTNKEKGIFGIGTNWSSIHYSTNWFRSWGRPEYGPDGDTRGWLISPDMKEFRFANNELVKEFYNNWYRPLLDARAHPKAEDQVEGGLFVAGLMAMHFGHHGLPRRQWLRIKDKWEYPLKDAFIKPVGPEGRLGTAQESQNWMVGGQTKYPEESLRLIGVYTSTDAGVWECTVAESGYASRKSVFTHPKVLEIVPIYEEDAKILESEALEPGPVPWNLRYTEARDVYSNLNEPLREGKVTWDEQAPVVQEEVQKIFDQDRP